MGVNNLPGEADRHGQLGPLPSMVPADAVEASAEHVPTRQRGRATRRAVQRTGTRGAPKGFEKAAKHPVKIEAQPLSADGVGHGWQGSVFENYAQVLPEDKVGGQLDGVEAPVEPAPFLAEYEALDRYPMGKFTQLSARFDRALGFENVDEFGQEVVGVKKRLRDGFESVTELETYQASVEGKDSWLRPCLFLVIFESQELFAVSHSCIYTWRIHMEETTEVDPASYDEAAYPSWFCGV